MALAKILAGIPRRRRRNPLLVVGAWYFRYRAHTPPSFLSHPLRSVTAVVPTLPLPVPPAMLASSPACWVLCLGKVLVSCWGRIGGQVMGVGDGGEADGGLRGEAVDERYSEAVVNVVTVSRIRLSWRGGGRWLALCHFKSVGVLALMFSLTAVGTYPSLILQFAFGRVRDQSFFSLLFLLSH